MSRPVQIAGMRYIRIAFSCEYDAYTCAQGAVLGPGEFFEGLALGGREFFSSTIGKDG